MCFGIILIYYAVWSTFLLIKACLYYKLKGDRQEKMKCKEELKSLRFTLYRTLSWRESFYKNNTSLSATFDRILFSSMLGKKERLEEKPQPITTLSFHFVDMLPKIAFPKMLSLVSKVLVVHSHLQ